jgi:hypothetical protein
MREREGLIARVRQMRRVAAETERRETEDRGAGTLRSLETRVAHLEGLLEALQDSVHRESIRQNRRISELEAQTEPGALAVALSRDARERGL